MTSLIRRRVVPAVIVLILALSAILVQSILDDSHFTTADASWSTCSHQTQNIHELSNPPAGWPGTRAAHTVTRFTSTNSQTFYTKGGWWDPRWDFYKVVVYSNTVCV